MLDPQRESSLFAYHETFAKNLEAVMNNIATGGDKAEQTARQFILSNIVYARSLSEGVKYDDKGLPDLGYLALFEKKASLHQCLAEMVRWQKEAKLTPQIMSMFGNSYYTKLKRAGADV